MTATGAGTAALQERWQAVMMNNYGVPPIALVAGDGAVVTDADGKRYVDLLAGIAVNIVGHRNRAVADAVAGQLATLGHTSNLYVTEPGVRLAERLVAALGVPARAFLCNSGTEANEAAFKISRRTGRTKIVAAKKAFHGRTMGALALTGQPAKQAPFAPLPGDVTFVPYGDVDALAAAVDDETAALFLEPILGESGVITPPAGYLAAARELTTAHGALLVFDEVQTGIARTGTFYAHQAEIELAESTGSDIRIVPDVMTLAKGLGGGLPIGAVLATGDTADLLEPGQHGSTFGGNAVCAAAANAVLDEVERLGLADRARSLGKTLAAGIEGLGHPLVSHVRGRGLLLGVVLTADRAAAVERAARTAGYLLNAPAPDVLRLAPPLVLTDAQAAAFIADLPAILDAAGAAS